MITWPSPAFLSPLSESCMSPPLRLTESLKDHVQNRQILQDTRPQNVFSIRSIRHRSEQRTFSEQSAALDRSGLFLWTWQVSKVNSKRAINHPTGSNQNYRKISRLGMIHPYRQKNSHCTLIQSNKTGECVSNRKAVVRSEG